MFSACKKNSIFYIQSFSKESNRRKDKNSSRRRKKKINKHKTVKENLLKNFVRKTTNEMSVVIQNSFEVRHEGRGRKGKSEGEGRKR